jgi:sugar diacid utilization regulator
VHAVQEVAAVEPFMPAASSVDTRALRAFSAVTAAMTSEHELDALLHHIAEQACEVLGVNRASIHLIDGETGLLRGCVGRAAGDIDEHVKRIVGGMPADRLTAEIMRTRRPVFVPNAQEDPRVVRAAMRRWRVRSLLAVPIMLDGDVIGLLCLDDEAKPCCFSTRDQELAATFGQMAGAVIVQAQRTEQLRTSLRTVARQHRQLRRAGEIDQGLMAALLKGATLREIADQLSGLVGKPCGIYDSSFRQLAAGSAQERSGATIRVFDRDVRTSSVGQAMLSRLREGEATLAGPIPSLGVHHRHLVASIVADGDRWGYVALMEHGTALAISDQVALPRIAGAIALQLTAQQRAADADWGSSDALLRALLDENHDRRTLELHAQFLGVRLEAPRMLIHLAARSTSRHPAPTPAATKSALMALSTPMCVLTVACDDGVAALVELPSDHRVGGRGRWLAEQLRGAMDALAPEGGLLAAVSAECRGADAITKASSDVRQVLACMQEHIRPTGNHVLSVEDLGTARYFLAAIDAAEARAFADRALGDLVTTVDDTMLVTLRAFWECARQVRATARRLGVHQNTVRYRVKRVEEITGLALTTDADAQMTMHIALMVLRLGGRLPDIVPAGVHQEEETGDAEQVVVTYERAPMTG